MGGVGVGLVSSVTIQDIPAKLILNSWWRHQMETFSALLAIYAGTFPVAGEFPTQRPVTRSFDVFFDLRLNKRLRKQSRGWWLETLSRPLWRQCNVKCRKILKSCMVITFCLCQSLPTMLMPAWYFPRSHGTSHQGWLTIPYSWKCPTCSVIKLHDVWKFEKSKADIKPYAKFPTPCGSFRDKYRISNLNLFLQFPCCY